MLRRCHEAGGTVVMLVVVPMSQVVDLPSRSQQVFKCCNGQMGRHFKVLNADSTYELHCSRPAGQLRVWTTPLQPGVFGARAALRAAAVTARVLLPVAMQAGITGEQLAAERRRAASHDGPPGFGLRSAQEVISQIRRAKLAQRIGQGGAHGAPGSVPGLHCRRARQLRQQCQRGIVCAPARSRHVKVAPGRAQLGVA